MLYEALAEDDAGTPVADLAAAGVTQVHRTEVIEVGRPVGITIFSTGWTPTDWTFEVRVYAAADESMEAPQLALDDILPVVWDLLPGQAGPSTWNIDFVPDLAALVAFAEVLVGREDF